MKSKQRYTPETIEVFPIDMERLNTAIEEFFHKGLPLSNITYRARGILAIIRQPKQCVIDDEFVGHDVSKGITFYVYEEEEHPDGRHTFDCYPTHEVTMPLPELEIYLKSPTTLAEFSKGRRGYNARIRGNEADWIKYLNS